MSHNLFTYFFACLRCASGLFAKQPTRQDYGNVIVLHLYGTWQEMGVQYGTLLKKEIQRTYQFAKVKATKDSDAFLLPQGNYCGLYLLDKLFDGVTQGAGITLEQLRTINGVELAYMDILNVAQEGKCASLALFGDKTKNGQMFCGRNYDWLNNFDQLGIVVTCFHPANGSLPMAIINYPGCLYLTTAMNSQGLFLELNTAAFSSTDYCDEGVHNVWILWLVLSQAHTTPQAVNILQTLRAKSCYLINLADPIQAAAYEWDTKHSMLFKTSGTVGFQVMTNHYIRPGWKHLPSAYEGGKESSINRYQALQHLASQVPPHTGDLETMKCIFSVTTQNNGALSKDTLFQVLAVPAERKMLIRTRSSSQWVPFQF